MDTDCRLPDSSRRTPGILEHPVTHVRNAAGGSNLYTVTCPRCSRRPAKRPCPALGVSICPTCCATERLVEIRCPADCPYLASAQKHPAAVVRRQQEHDLSALMISMGRRLTEPQLQILFLLASVIARYRPEGLVTLLDTDVADAAGAMAGTLEAASRGLIAEIRGASPASEGLRRQIDAVLAEIGKGGGARYARDAAEVLRGIERGAKHEGAVIGDGSGDYLTLLRRVLPPPPDETPAPEASPIILP
jgi:hypothetical protein